MGRPESSPDCSCPLRTSLTVPTKIEQTLTPEQVEALCSQLFATPGGTLLKSIQQAAARFGVRVSLMGASAFRDGKLSLYLASLRGKTLRYQDRDFGPDIPVPVTYHPAYLLRNLPDKARAWEDLCLARRTMQALVTA